MRFSTNLSSVASLACSFFFQLAHASMHDAMDKAMSFQRDQLQRMGADFLGPPDTTEPETINKRQSPITFSNPKAQDFFVDGSTLPDGWS